MKIVTIVRLAGSMPLALATNQALAISTADINYPDASRVFTLATEQFFSSGSLWGDQFVSAGQGNITGNQNVPAGWTVTVDGSRNGATTNLFSILTGNTASAGSFSLNSAAWDTYDHIAIGLKVGNNLNPDWAIFELAKYAQSGSWSTMPKQGGGLSHYVVYTKMDDGIDYPAAVPLPSGLWLFGGGLLSLLGATRQFDTGRRTTAFRGGSRNT